LQQRDRHRQQSGCDDGQLSLKLWPGLGAHFTLMNIPRCVEMEYIPEGVREVRGGRFGARREMERRREG
jgi:hypothetical protein